MSLIPNHMRTVEYASAGVGEISDNGLNHIAQYLTSLQSDVSNRVGKLPTYDEFASGVESEYKSGDGSTYRYAFIAYLRATFGTDVHVSLAPTLSNWAQGPLSVWEANRVRSLKQWYRWLAERAPMVDNLQSVPAYGVAKQVGTQWLVTGKGTYVGTYPKRLARYVANTYNCRLMPSHLETIGTIAKDNVDDSTHVYFSFDQNFLNGSASEYGNAGSCWWGSYGAGRTCLLDAGGYAIREWKSVDDDSRYPKSRVWIAPVEIPESDDTVYVLFNAYGRRMESFARIIADASGLSYRNVGLTCEQCDGVYINGNCGTLIAASDVIDEIGDDYHIELDWYAENGTHCESCECWIDDDNVYFGNDCSYCESCFSDMFSHCEHCGETHSDDDMLRTEDGMMFCDSDCANNGDYDSCSDCSEWYPNGELTSVDDGDEGYVCEYCSRNYSTCDDCGSLVTETTPTRESSDVCDSCLGNYDTCERCDCLSKHIDVDDCPDCVRETLVDRAAPVGAR